MQMIILNLNKESEKIMVAYQAMEVSCRQSSNEIPM